MPEALTALTKLPLLKCCFLDANAVQQLPRLQQLEAVGMRHRVTNTLEQEPHVLFQFGSKVLQQLEGLTHLELEHCELDLPTSEPLLQLSNLRSLRLRDFKSSSSNADRLLAGMQHLTMLELQPLLPQGVQFAILPQDIISGRSQLQHLDLSHYMHTGNAAAITNFLCDLEQLTQLTHLGLHGTLSLPDNYKALPAAAAYAALTASSKLKQLHLPACKMPAGAWKHMLPFGRQLPHLQELQLSDCPKMGVFDVVSSQPAL